MMSNHTIHLTGQVGQERASFAQGDAFAESGFQTQVQFPDRTNSGQHGPLFQRGFVP